MQTTLIECPGGLTGSYTIPGGVTNIEQDAFYYCSGLTSITIPGGVTNLVDYAFSGCWGLTSLYFMGNAPTADASIFVGFFRNVTAYYLAGTTGWAEFATNTGALIAPWNSPNPQVLTTGPDFGVRNNSFGFTISGGTNLSVVVEACTNLNERIWSPVATNNLTNGSFYFSEPLQGSAGERFYRISSQ